MHGIHSSSDASSARDGRRRFRFAGVSNFASSGIPRASDPLASDAAGDADDAASGEWAARDREGVSRRESERGEDK
jgi:hypothetical protein